MVVTISAGASASVQATEPESFYWENVATLSVYGKIIHVLTYPVFPAVMAWQLNQWRLSKGKRKDKMLRSWSVCVKGRA